MTVNSSDTETTLNTDVNPAVAPSDAAPAQDVDPTVDPSTTEGEDREDLLSIAQDAIKETPDEGEERDPDELVLDEETPTEDTPPSEQSAKEETEEEDDKSPLSDEVTPEELDSYKPRTRARIEKLLSENRTYRTDLETLKPLTDQLVSQQMTVEEASSMFEVSHAWRSGDYVKFLNMMGPYINHALQAGGYSIAPDLQDRVREGYITEQDAKAQTQDRIRAQQYEAQVQHLQNQQAAQTQQFQAQQAEQNIGQLVQAQDAWVAQTRQSDPDYADKHSTVMRFATAALREGAPQTPQDVTAILDTALAETNALFQKARPAPKATKPVPNGVSTPTNVRAEPKGMEDAALQGLRDFHTAAG